MRGALLALSALMAALPASAQSPGNPRLGETLYQEKCVLCHGGAGQGWDWSKKVYTPPVPVPYLATVFPRRGNAFLFSVVRDGGEAVGQTRFMPPFGFQLSDQEVWHLVAYMRSLKK